MSGFPSPFGSAGGEDDLFDETGTFVPEHVPTPGAFLEGHEVLTGDDHVAVHGTARTLFEARGVYDMTFGYNLARLNLDTRHPGAGYRYAVEAGDGSVLRAEFTPTTPFCPQSDTLTRGSFRAWNGLSDRHEYDLVRIRVDGMHHRSGAINDTLEDLENRYLDTGTVGDAEGLPGQDCGEETTSRGYSPDAPF